MNLLPITLQPSLELSQNLSIVQFSYPKFWKKQTFLKGFWKDPWNPHLSLKKTHRANGTWFFSSRAMRWAPSTKTPVTKFIITSVASVADSPSVWWVDGLLVVISPWSIHKRSPVGFGLEWFILLLEAELFLKVMTVRTCFCQHPSTCFGTLQVGGQRLFPSSLLLRSIKDMLMEEILNYLGHIYNPCKSWDKLPTSTG